MEIGKKGLKALTAWWQLDQAGLLTDEERENIRNKIKERYGKDNNPLGANPI